MSRQHARSLPLRNSFEISKQSKVELRFSSSILAIACVAATFSATALAQEATNGANGANGTTQAPAAATLPEVSVISEKKPAKAKKKKKSVVKSSAPVENPGALNEPPPEPAKTLSQGLSTNPYANPNAPYMVERSASGKLTQPLVDTPRTVTAVPKEVIEDKGAKDLRELARTTPGLTIGSAEGGNAYGAFAVRGFKANNDIFVDGIRNPGNIIPDVFSVEQVEIYKGPSGGIAGRSTIGGAVNIISKQPDFDFNFYELATTFGTDSTIRTTIDANQKITSDFAVRANVMYDQHDIAGRDITDSERWGGLFSATAKPADGLQITLDYYRYRNHAIPDWGVPVRNVDNVPVTELGYPRDMWVGMVGLDFFDEKSDIGTATVVAKLADGVTLTNKSRVGQTRVNYVATSMEGYPDVHHPNRDQIANLYANQTELNVKFATGMLKHDMVAGVEVTREKIARSGYSVSNNFDTLRPFPPNPYSQIDTILGKGKVYDATIDTIGTYLTDTVHLSEQWIVNGGFRFDDFSRDQVGGTGAAGTTDPATNTASVQDNLFSWNAGIVYKPIPIASFYAAYATAESPIGSELDSTGAQYNGVSPTLVNVPPQEARSVEIGTKWELFDKRLLATAALFQTDVDHARTNDNVTADDDTNAFKGKYRVRGIELSAAGNITDTWSVFGGLVLLDTEVLRSSNPQDIGRRLANVPLTQFSMLSKHKITDKLTVAGQATYGGEVYGGHLAANASNNHTVNWWRFDAFAEYQLTDQIEIELSGINLTDELYYDAIYQAADTFAFVAPGRAGYLTVKWKY